ncbi:MAG: RNA polymerase sigma factor [Bacteroidia bacterium]|nr:RNA polymerase sigma factor [Bacteroidia bacterium]
MSFDEVYKEYYRELTRFSRQLNHSTDRSEDLVQETFMKYFLELRRNTSIKNPRAWLYKVLLNSFRTQIKSDKKELQVMETLNIKNDLPHDLQTDLFSGEKLAIVSKVLDTLPDNVREILVLYNIGFSYTEIAEIMDINPASVGTTLVRAINKLKEILKLHYHEMFEQN